MPTTTPKGTFSQLEEFVKQHPTLRLALGTTPEEGVSGVMPVGIPLTKAIHAIEEPLRVSGKGLGFKRRFPEPFQQEIEDAVKVVKEGIWRPVLDFIDNIRWMKPGERISLRNPERGQAVPFGEHVVVHGTYFPRTKTITLNPGGPPTTGGVWDVPWTAPGTLAHEGSHGAVHQMTTKLGMSPEEYRSIPPTTKEALAQYLSEEATRRAGVSIPERISVSRYYSQEHPLFKELLKSNLSEWETTNRYLKEMLEGLKPTAAQVGSHRPRLVLDPATGLYKMEGRP